MSGCGFRGALRRNARARSCGIPGARGRKGERECLFSRREEREREEGEGRGQATGARAGDAPCTRPARARGGLRGRSDPQRKGHRGLPGEGRARRRARSRGLCFFMSSSSPCSLFPPHAQSLRFANPAAQGPDFCARHTHLQWNKGARALGGRRAVAVGFCGGRGRWRRVDRRKKRSLLLFPLARARGCEGEHLSRAFGAGAGTRRRANC